MTPEEQYEQETGRCGACHKGKALIDVVSGKPVEPDVRTYGAVWKDCERCGGTGLAKPRLMEAEDIGWTPCMDGDHDWRYEHPEWDVGFYGFKECKECGHTAALEPGDGEYEEYE